MEKIKEKKKAIRLRKQGLSYSEILEKIPVARASLSFWFKDIDLNEDQKRRLINKRMIGQIRGGESRRNDRILREKEVRNKAAAEVKGISAHDLWLIGTILYWAEGAKEKDWLISVGLKFSNSDPLMIKLYVKWLKEICLISEKDIIYELYIHKVIDLGRCRLYWEKELKIDDTTLRVYFKNNIVKRKNLNNNYKGLITVRVKKSTDLNRKVAGWIEGICNHCRVV